MKYYPTAKSNQIKSNQIRQDFPEIIELLKTQTLQQIADKYKTSRGTLYGYLKETGKVPFKRQKTYPCSTPGCPRTITTSWVKRPATKCKQCIHYDWYHKEDPNMKINGRMFQIPKLCIDCGKEKPTSWKGLCKRCNWKVLYKSYYHRVLKHDPEFIRKRDIRNRKYKKI